MEKKVIEKCWICGEAATSGEHKTKRTDLQLAFGKPTQERPLFLHDDKRTNRHVRSFKADILKSSAHICAHCNNARTQDHDQAWEAMSAYIYRRSPAFKPDDEIRVKHFFKKDTKQRMLAVHLYFLKLFGCKIKENDQLPQIDLKPFADAILKGQPHPNVYLDFAQGTDYVGPSHLDVQHADNFKKIYAQWMYQLPWITVFIIYATASEHTAEHMRRGLVKAWHPKGGKHNPIISDIILKSS
jgi:hypothetical protein